MNCLVLLLALSTSLLPPGPLAGFRHPEWQTFKFGLSNGSVSARADFSGGASGDGRFGLTPYAEFQRSGEELGLWARLYVPLSTTPYSARREPESVFYSTSRSGDADLNLSSAASWFPFGLPLGFHYTLNAGASGSSNQQTGVWPESSRVTYRISSKSASAMIWAGPAFGRVRDATPLLTALRFEEILREEGLIDRDLPQADVEELASRLARRDYWSGATLFDRYTRRWFDDIESFVRTRLRAGTEIPARIWFRVRDAATNATPVYTEARLVGINFVPWVGFRAEHMRQREEWPRDSAWRETAEDEYKPMVGGMHFEAGYPMTTRLYMHLNAVWTPDFDRSQFASHDNIDASVDYLIFDRLDLRASVEHDGGRQSGSWWNIDERVGIRATWYAEDKMSVSGGLWFSLHAGRVDTGEYERSRDIALDVSFDWRLF